MKTIEQPVSTESADIDVRELAFFLWGKKWVLAISAMAGISLAAIYVQWIAEPKYESSALLLPVQNNNMEQLGAASLLVGGKMTSNSDVSLYQSLLTSRTVIEKLIRSEIPDSGNPSTKSRRLFQYLSLDTGNRFEMDMSIKELSSKIKVDSKGSESGGMLEVKGVASTPWLAKAITTNVLQIGQEEIRMVRIERSSVILSRLDQAVNQAKREWDSAARNLSYFQDRNRSITLPDQFYTSARLEIEKQAKEQKYLLARKEYEMILLENAKAAPPMMILDPAALPSKAAWPRRKLTLAFGLLVGFFGSAAALMTARALMIPKRIDSV